jgi:hypothetical protein
MKISGRASGLGACLVACFLSGSINLCRAQVLVKGGGNQSETLVQLASVPSFGTFWSAALSIPPSPFDPLPQLPLYAYGPASNQVYVYDDGDFDYSASSAAMASANNSGMLPMDDGSPLTPPGGGTNTSGGGGGPSFVYPDFTTNDLWLQILTMTNQTAALVIHPPWNVTNGVYDLLYTTNLAPSNSWQWVMRTAPGQTNLLVTNATATQGFYKLGSANTSAGTDFWVAFPYVTYYSVMAISLYISSPLEATGMVTMPSLGINKSFSVMPGVVTNIALPYQTIIQIEAGNPEPDPVWTNGIHITASQPVSIYGVYYSAELSTAFTGCPTQGLGTNYCLLAHSGGYTNFNSELTIIATTNNTTVTITPSTNADLSVSSGTNSYTETLQQGETYLIHSKLGSDDVTGTRVTSDYPIAIFAGANLAYVNAPDYSDYKPLVQEQLPVATWGNQALALSFAGRTGGDDYRVLAVNSNTVVSTNGVVAATLQAGQFYETIIDGPVQFQGSHPIQVAHFANAEGYDNPPNLDGGACEILLPSTGQYSTSYTVYSLTNDDITGDFDTNFLNIIVKNSATLTTLDGTNINLLTTNFVAIGSSGYSGAQIPVSPGTHKVSSSQPMEVEVYGFGGLDAYGYVGGVINLP